jgi:4-hydroxy-3-polyprenylbenzoate decarboxylase
MKTPNLVVAITGASGLPYAARLLETLLQADRVVHLTISPAGAQVIAQELGRQIDLDNFAPADLLPNLESPLAGRLLYHHYQDFGSGIASGSFHTEGMVVCPCSMGTVAAIANGLSDNLIHRAADVHLKERRRLILVPRETPLNLVHLRNMMQCTEAGAIVLPAMPGFYARPRTLQDAIDFIVARICDELKVAHLLSRRWGEPLD